MAKTENQKRRPWWVYFGLAVTAIYSGLILWVRWPISLLTFETLPPNSLGDLLAGVFAPLAFLWFFVATMIQSQELAMQREDLGETREILAAQLEANEREAAGRLLDHRLTTFMPWVRDSLKGSRVRATSGGPNSYRRLVPDPLHLSDDPWIGVADIVALLIEAADSASRWVAEGREVAIDTAKNRLEELHKRIQAIAELRSRVPAYREPWFEKNNIEAALTALDTLRGFSIGTESTAS